MEQEHRFSEVEDSDLPHAENTSTMPDAPSLKHGETSQPVERRQQLMIESSYSSPTSPRENIGPQSKASQEDQKTIQPYDISDEQSDSSIANELASTCSFLAEPPPALASSRGYQASPKQSPQLPVRTQHDNMVGTN